MVLESDDGLAPADAGISPLRLRLRTARRRLQLDSNRLERIVSYILTGMPKWASCGDKPDSSCLFGFALKNGSIGIHLMHPSASLKNNDHHSISLMLVERRFLVRVIGHTNYTNQVILEFHLIVLGRSDCRVLF